MKILLIFQGVIGCPECKHKLQVKISVDDIMEPPWQAYNVMKKMDYPYEESMWYDQLRDVVAKRSPGWEQLQKAIISIDPDRARNDPVIVKNVPYYKAKKALEAEVMKLDPPPRPPNLFNLLRGFI